MVSLNLCKECSNVAVCDDIQNTILTPHKELHFLLYRMPCYLIICRSYEFLKWSSFLPTLYITTLNTSIHAFYFAARVCYYTYTIVHFAQTSPITNLLHFLAFGQL